MAEKKKGCGSRVPPKKPKSWEKAVIAAYFISLGHTEKESAAYAGVSESTITDWKNTTWWHDAVEESHDRWVREFRAGVKAGLNRSLQDPFQYATTSRWAGERLIKELAPPSARHEISGPDGGPVEVSTDRGSLAAEIARIAARADPKKIP